MPAMLTVERDDDGNPESYGSTCPDHPEFNREGLAQRHAMNVVAKHNRESHAEPVLNLSAAAVAISNLASSADSAEWVGAIAVWEALTGLPSEQAEAYFRAVLTEPQDVLVHVAPF